MGLNPLLLNYTFNKHIYKLLLIIYNRDRYGQLIIAVIYKRGLNDVFKTKQTGFYEAQRNKRQDTDRPKGWRVNSNNSYSDVTVIIKYDKQFVADSSSHVIP